MSNLKKVVVPCVTWIVFLIAILNIIPISQSIGIKPSTVYYAPEAMIIIEKEITDSVWNISKTIEIDFTVRDPIYAINVTTPFEFKLLAYFSRWQVTKIKYEFICNGEISRIVTEDLVGTSFNIIGSYEDKPLKNSLLRSGTNNFALRISVVSTCDEVCRSSFKLILRDLRVQNHVLDLDRDGIWDNVDSVPMNNYVSTVLLGMMSTPIVGYAGLVIGRSLEKKKRLTRKN